MMLWGVILLIINVLLLGALLYIMLFRKPVAKSRENVYGPPDELVKSINDGLSEVRSVARRLETRSEDLSRHENGLLEKQAALEALITRTIVSANSGSREPQDKDVYASALNMLKSGVPSSEIARNLGLLSGEAELLSSLHRL